MGFKIKNEEWSNAEIEEACSFTALTNRIYDKIQLKTPKFSFSANVHSQEDFLKWSGDFRNQLLEILGIKDMMEERTDVIVVKNYNSSQTEYFLEKNR